MNRIVHAIAGTILLTGDYLVHVNRIVACKQASRHEHCMVSVNMQNYNRCEQDSRREQNSPRYSGDFPVHRGLRCLRKQDSPH